MSDLVFEKDLLNAIAGRLQKYNIRTRLDPGDGEGIPDMLKASLAPLSGNDGVVICEMCFLHFENRLPVLQYYSTLAVSIKAEAIAELEKAVARLNLLCPLGCFGIFYEGSQLYHKYAAVLDGEIALQEAEKYCEEVLELLLNTLGSQYETLLDLADGKITYDEAIIQGRIKL